MPRCLLRIAHHALANRSPPCWLPCLRHCVVEGHRFRARRYIPKAGPTAPNQSRSEIRGDDQHRCEASVISCKVAVTSLGGRATRRACPSSVAWRPEYYPYLSLQGVGRRTIVQPPAAAVGEVTQLHRTKPGWASCDAERAPGTQREVVLSAPRTNGGFAGWQPQVQEPGPRSRVGRRGWSPWRTPWRNGPDKGRRFRIGCGQWCASATHSCTRGTPEPRRWPSRFWGVSGAMAG